MSYRPLCLERQTDTVLVCVFKPRGLLLFSYPIQPRKVWSISFAVSPGNCVAGYKDEPAMVPDPRRPWWRELTVDALCTHTGSHLGTKVITNDRASVVPHVMIQGLLELSWASVSPSVKWGTVWRMCRIEGWKSALDLGAPRMKPSWDSSLLWNSGLMTKRLSASVSSSEKWT